MKRRRRGGGRKYVNDKMVEFYCESLVYGRIFLNFIYVYAELGYYNAESLIILIHSSKKQTPHLPNLEQ